MNSSTPATQQDSYPAALLDLSDASSRRALAALHALGQQSRLSIFRLLAWHEPHGLAAGAIADILQAPQNTVSGHLGVLAQAELVTRIPQGRTVVYRANPQGMRSLLDYLNADCCGGNPALCAFTGARFGSAGDECFSPPMSL